MTLGSSTGAGRDAEPTPLPYMAQDSAAPAGGEGGLRPQTQPEAPIGGSAAPACSRTTLPPTPLRLTGPLARHMGTAGSPGAQGCSPPRQALTGVDGGGGWWGSPRVPTATTGAGEGAANLEGGAGPAA